MELSSNWNRTPLIQEEMLGSNPADSVMKYYRYLLFGLENYYPDGARHDVIGSFDKLEEVKDRIKKNHPKYDWYDVLDLEERRWIDL